MNTVEVNFITLDEGCPPPRVAYDGTSAAFDVACSEDTTIPPGQFKVVPVGHRYSIDEKSPFYMQVHLRSSYGFKKGLRCHIGIIDAGYTGDFGVSVVNNTQEEITIKRGDYFAQVLVIEKPQMIFKEMNKVEWEEYASKQNRGSGSFGSSGK